MKSLNTVFSSLRSRRRYEVWFLRLGLANGEGAWWFRYLLLNPGRQGCGTVESGMPVQVWASYFPVGAKPRTFIQGFGLDTFRLSAKGQDPFHLAIENNAIDENSCRGDLHVDGHHVTWDLRYQSSFGTTLSNKGWIGFSRTPHSDALFSGQISLDGQKVEGSPLGFGLQGHNCGYRHRNFWSWGHAYFAGERPSTLEALVYDLPLGMTFRRAILWREGKRYDFRIVRESEHGDGSLWNFVGRARDGSSIEAEFSGEAVSCHHLPYMKTNCSGSFKVANNSLANARVRLQNGDMEETLATHGGAVLEMGGKR
jgi:hypothetical protein